jgi:predicted RNase H-like nuclease (RuvC/YqgF family)
MKKIVFFLMAVALFASQNDDINKKLDTLLNAVMQLKQEMKKKDAEINKLKKELQNQNKEIKKQDKTLSSVVTAKDCKKIKVVYFKDEYEGDVIPSYELDFRLKNEYPKKVVFLEGNLFAEDSDGVKILQDFIKRKVSIPSGKSIKIHKQHIINNDLEKYLKDENVKDLHIYFKAIKIKFADGSEMECPF